MVDRIWSGVLIGFVLVLSTPALANEFLDARQEVIRGDYRDGLKHLEEYLEKKPKGKHASRAYLFKGKAYVGLKQYAKAKEAYRELMERYPDSLEGYKAQYKIAEIEMLTGNEIEARRWFEKMKEEKNGPFTSESEMYLDYLDLH